jgi:hypothetical protein
MKPHVWSLTHWISCPAALLAYACVAQTVSKQSASSDPLSGLVISDVTVISPERAAPLEHAHVNIRDGRIEEVSGQLRAGRKSTGPAATSFPA